MFQDSEIILREKFFSDFQTNRVLVSQCDSKGRNSPLHVIKEGRFSLFGSHGKGTGSWVSHCNVGVPVEVKIFLSQKIFQLFSIYVFCGEATKKTSIDGLKWRDLVMGRWLVNFVVSAVRCHKGFHVLNSARKPSPCKRPRARGQPIPPQSYSISK